MIGLSLPLIVSLRLLFPLTILRWPLAGLLGSIFLDNLDWFAFGVQTKAEYFNYQLIDKFLDTYFLSLALLVALGWRETAARIVSFWSFFYRLIGVGIYWLTQNEAWFLLFPNYFETFFLFYLIFKLFRPRENLFSSATSYWAILPLTLVPKLIHELIHLTEGNEQPFVVSFYEQRDLIIYSGYILFFVLALIWRLNQKKGTR